MKRCKRGASHGTQLLIFFLAATVFCLSFHLLICHDIGIDEQLFYWLTHLCGSVFIILGAYLIWRNMVCE